MTEDADQALEATGERLVPGLQHGELVHAEHLARYRLAAELAPSRRVLDAACGEGYGTRMLAAAGASASTGLDVDERTVAHARARYPDASFVAGDVRALPFENGSFDLVVSFETIEHVVGPERVLDEFARVLGDDGLLLISTPNKHRYLVDNEFHVREFHHEEFVELLTARFASVELLLQQNLVASAVLPAALAGDETGAELPRLSFGKLAGVGPGEELYTLALCGSGPGPELSPVVVAAAPDEAQELARRVVDAEQTAAKWHAEYERAMTTAERWEGEHTAEVAKLVSVYGSIWWRMTAPLRRLADLLRRRG